MNLSQYVSILCLLATNSNTLLGPSNMLLASAQVAPECSSTVDYSYDSGETAGVFTTVKHSTSPWIQLDLSGTYLGPNARLILVGEKTSQTLDASALDVSNGYSAVFDGDFVNVELVTPGGGIRSGSTSRFIISSLNVGLCDDDDDMTGESICAVTDDRIPSTDVRAGRIGGCTGWLILENVFIQAGHCGTPGTSTFLQFTYGVGSAAPEDQYAVDVETYTGVNGGVGNDWGAGRLLQNSVTKLLPGVAQEAKCMAAGENPGCGWYTLGKVPSTTDNNNIRITGYGTAAVDSRSQKTHMDSLTVIASNYLKYVADTTGGNSGSPVIHEETGHAIGVHTHGGCDSGGNQGTRIDLAEFAAHVEWLTKTCTQDSDCFINGPEQCDANGQCQFGDASSPTPTASPTPVPTSNPTEPIINCSYTKAKMCKKPCKWNGKDKICTGP